MRDARRRKRYGKVKRLSNEARTGNRKKKIIIGACIGVVIVCGAVLLILQRFGGSSDETVPVSSVTSIMGIGSGSGGQNRYAGVIESQKSWTAKKDSSRNIKKVYVKEGDKVEIGDKLFQYDESSMEDELAEAKIELQQYDIDIADLQSQVRELEKEKATAASADKLSYTIQIQSAQNDIKKNKYEKEQKQKEINKMKKNKKKTTVVSELAGVVTKVNSYTNSEDSSDEEDLMTEGSDSGDDLIKITGIGNYRVKCKINEQNYSDIAEGDSMLVHSRVDENLSWSGQVSAVDSGSEGEEASEDEEMESDESVDEMTSSSSYTFYVDLDSSENLLLGQHVYVEPDNGQSAHKDGVWLDEAFICDVEGDAYVWADDGHGRLTKKTVVLGSYNEELFQYEITAGLTLEDKVAYPDDTYEKGMRTEEEDYAAESFSDDGEEPLDGEDADLEDAENFAPEYEEDFNDGLDGGVDNSGAIGSDIEEGE